MLKLFRSSAHLGQPWPIQKAAMRSMLARADQEERSFKAIAKDCGEHVDGAWGRILDPSPHAKGQNIGAHAVGAEHPDGS